MSSVFLFDKDEYPMIIDIKQGWHDHVLSSFGLEDQEPDLLSFDSNVPIKGFPCLQVS